MSEEYCGVQFKTVFIQKNVLDNPEISELINWCTEFNKMGFTPGYDGNGSFGNLSFRTEKGFIISCSRADFSKVAVEDFTEVTEIETSKKEVYVKGLRKPSSESFMHNEIYEKRNDINAVFHGHCEDFLKYGDKLGLAITQKEQPAGTIELMTEVTKVLKDNNFILIREHGFICLGDSMDSAGKLAIKMYSQLQKIKKLL